jgi:signal peptidase I
VVIFGGSYLQEGAEEVVPPGFYFVAGDNRPHSSDSREFGPVPMEDFIGTVFFRYWPFSQMGGIPHPTYNIQ